MKRTYFNLILLLSVLWAFSACQKETVVAYDPVKIAAEDDAIIQQYIAKDTSIHNAVKTRRGSRLNLGNGIDLTVAEGTVVAPVTTKHLVAFDSYCRQVGLVLGINQTIAEIEDTGPGATGENLVKWIKWIEGINRGVRLVLTNIGTRRLTDEPRGV